jgi:hypothetical protein
VCSLSRTFGFIFCWRGWCVSDALPPLLRPSPRCGGEGGEGGQEEGEEEGRGGGGGWFGTAATGIRPTLTCWNYMPKTPLTALAKKPPVPRPLAQALTVVGNANTGIYVAAPAHSRRARVQRSAAVWPIFRSTCTRRCTHSMREESMLSTLICTRRSRSVSIWRVREAGEALRRTGAEWQGGARRSRHMQSNQPRQRI